MKVDSSVYTMRDVLHRPVSIRSMEGIIVVTSEDDCCDHILSVGDSLQIRPRGMLAIRGLSSEARALVFGGRTGQEGRNIEFHTA